MSKNRSTIRLVDVLKRNSPQALQRHAEQLAVLRTAFPPGVMESRSRQNSFLISPKSLHVMIDQDVLRHSGVFAVYKPPFCPMKRSEAHENYHRVSVESFVHAAIKSRDIAPIMREMADPAEINIRVLYNLARESSGPVLISLLAKDSFVLSLRHYRFLYQLLVAGHLSVQEKSQTMTPEEASWLYPGAPLGESFFQYRVVEIGYYAHHPVSLVEVDLVSPSSAKPPALDEFVRKVLHTFIVGDTMSTGAGSSPHGKVNSHALEMSIALRGDCDFPRVFTHLHSVQCSKNLTHWSASPTSGKESIEQESSPTSASPLHFSEEENTVEKFGFACRKCLESIFHPKVPRHGLKRMSMNIRDGSWSPMLENLP